MLVHRHFTPLVTSLAPYAQQGLARYRRGVSQSLDTRDSARRRGLLVCRPTEGPCRLPQEPVPTHRISDTIKPRPCVGSDVNEKRSLLLGGAFVLLSLAISVYALPRAPETVATHWNAAGQPDGTMGKFAGLFLLPAITAGVVALLLVVPKIDPRRENYAAFRPYYDGFVVAIAGYLTLIHAASVAYNLGYDVDVTTVAIGSVGLLLYYAGVVIGHAEPNWFVGIRTPWTLESDAVWHATHRLGARLFKLSGILALVGIFVPEYAIYLLLVPTLGTAVATFVYSFVTYRQLGGGEAAGE